jgi:hypothetical protein
MNKFLIAANTVIMIGAMFLSLYTDDTTSSLLYVISILNLIWYIFYFTMHRFIFKKEKFNNKLLLLPVLMAAVWYFYFGYLINLYATLHESRFSYINISENGIVSCQNSEVCEIAGQEIHKPEHSPETGIRFSSNFIIHRQVSKRYFVSRWDDCLSIYDYENTAFSYPAYKKCGLKPLTEQEALQSGFILYKPKVYKQR